MLLHYLGKLKIQLVTQSLKVGTFLRHSVWKIKALLLLLLLVTRLAIDTET